MQNNIKKGEVNMKKHVIKVCSIVLAGLLTLSGCTMPGNQTIPSLEGSISLPAEGALSVGQVTDYLIQAADDYNKPDRAAMLTGIDIGEEAKATRLQALVLLSRAFGPLPEPTGNNARIAAPAPDMSGVPDWAKADLENLAKGGVLTASDLGMEENEPSTPGGMDAGTGTDAGADVAATATGADTATDGTDGNASQPSTPVDSLDINEINAEQLQQLASRVWALFSSNLKDDFYNTVNKNELDSATIPAGETQGGGVTAMQALVNRRVNEIVQEIVNSSETSPQGSDEQKIKSFYENILDTESRNRLGITPLKPYLDAIDAAASFKELNQANAEAVKALGSFNSGVFDFYLTNDLKDNNMQVISLMPPFSALEKDYMVKLLTFAGEDAANAEKEAEAIYKMFAEMGLYETLPPADSTEGNLHNTSRAPETAEPETSVPEVDTDISGGYNHYTHQELEAMVPGIGMPEFFTAIGFKPSIGFTTGMPDILKAYATYLTEDNLELFKAYFKIKMLSANSGWLSEELAEMESSYYKELWNLPEPEESKSKEELAAELVGTYLSNEISKIYVKRFFPPEAKQGVEELGQELIEAFKIRVRNLEWMNETTKQEALKKLDGLKIMVGYPSQWPETAEILGKEDGGSFFENMTAIMRQRLIENTSKDGKRNPEDIFQTMSPISVNAASNRTTNVIVMPAGILQAPLYDVNASKEENLGGIGAIIGHEITHVFDDQGAQYDANGNMSDWWTPEDYDHFRSLYQKVVPFYNGKEVAPGVGVDGQGQLSENISDIGGVASALQVMAGMDNPDYDAFFRNYAKSWVKVSDRETLKMLAGSDHAPYKLRTNRVLSNFQEFFDFYGIKEGDGMYVAPQERIKIW